MVSTLDFESSDPSSNLGRTWTVFETRNPSKPLAHLMPIRYPLPMISRSVLNGKGLCHLDSWKTISFLNWQHVSVLDSIVVSIPACHAGDRGSIPRRGDYFYKQMSFFPWHLGMKWTQWILQYLDLLLDLGNWLKLKSIMIQSCYTCYTEANRYTWANLRWLIWNGKAHFLAYKTNWLLENCLSEVGFEPTPTDVDCDLNAAP